MSTDNTDVLICPHCAAALHREGASLRCGNGHSFDLARQGYVNLLRTRSTGDSAEMLRARRAFLEQGHYAPLAGAVCEIVGDHARVECRRLAAPAAGGAGAAVTTRILDSGCGEGYYLGCLKRHLSEMGGGMPFAFWGLDSSRDAVKMAAARYRENGYVVGDCKDMLPFADASLSVVLSVFAPRNAAEFARVLVPGGLLLLAMPAVDHLRELLDAIGLIGMEADKLRHVRDSMAGRFTERAARSIEYRMDLAAEDVALLATMTPSHRHNPGERLARLEPGRRYMVTAAFTVLVLRRA